MASIECARVGPHRIVNVSGLANAQTATWEKQCQSELTARSDICTNSLQILAHTARGSLNPTAIDTALRVRGQTCICPTRTKAGRKRSTSWQVCMPNLDRPGDWRWRQVGRHLRYLLSKCTLLMSCRIAGQAHRNLAQAYSAQCPACSSSAEAVHPNTKAMRSIFSSVTLRSPRSIFPMCDRSMPAWWASAS